jgi:hypothetical protein
VNPMTGIIVHDKDGNKHEILLPKDEHLLEYVRKAQRAIEKERLLDRVQERLEEERSMAKDHVDDHAGLDQNSFGSGYDRGYLDGILNAIEFITTPDDVTDTEEAGNGQFGVGV